MVIEQLLLKRFNPVEISVLCNIDKDIVVDCIELDIVNAIAKKFRRAYTDKPLLVLIKTRLKEADSSMVYRVHYRNASKFLKELKEVRD